MSSLTVITYWWTDAENKHVDKEWYGPDDVRRLQRQVKANLSSPHEFAVITDRPEAFADDADIRAIPIDYATHVPGRCYVRLMTFHPDGADIIGGRILQLDLDTLIVGSLDSIASRTADLVLWRNPARIPWESPEKPGRPYYNTSLVLHRCGTMPDLWEKFNPQVHPRIIRDDQWWLADQLGPNVPYVDGSDGVYRLAREEDKRTGVWGETLPDNARIITFPGSSGKPNDPHIRAENPWIEQYI
jgi:hypothetical protein